MIYKYGWVNHLYMLWTVHMEVISGCGHNYKRVWLLYLLGQVLESFKLFARERESEFLLQV